jgi:hypothetical protein
MSAVEPTIFLYAFSELRDFELSGLPFLTDRPDTLDAFAPCPSSVSI